MSVRTLPADIPMAAVHHDVERHAHDTSYLDNHDVQNLAWADISVTVPDREALKPKKILSGVSGHVEAGECRESVLRPATTHVGGPQVKC